MPGLLNATRSVATPGAAPQGPATEVPAQPSNVRPGDAGDDESNVSPEEQTQYTEFVTNGMRLMNDEKGLDGLLQSIQGDGNPVEGLANTVASIVIRVEDSAQKNGMEISGDVLMQGGTELLEQAADLAEQAGIHEFSETELESALYMAMDIYRETRQQQGKLPTEALGQELEGLRTADREGSIEDMIPGITEYAEKAQQEAVAKGQPSAQPGNAKPTAGQPVRPAGQPAPQPRRGLLR